MARKRRGGDSRHPKKPSRSESRRRLRIQKSVRRYVRDVKKIQKKAGTSYAAARRLAAGAGRRDSAGKLRKQADILAGALALAIHWEAVMNYENLYGYFKTAGEQHNTIEVALPFYQTEAPERLKSVPDALDLYREIGAAMDEQMEEEEDEGDDPETAEKAKKYRLWRVEYHFKWIYDNGMVALTEGPQELEKNAEKA
jgi:hypothetical protein